MVPPPAALVPPHRGPCSALPLGRTWDVSTRSANTMNGVGNEVRPKLTDPGWICDEQQRAPEVERVQELSGNCPEHERKGGAIMKGAALINHKIPRPYRHPICCHDLPANRPDHPCLPCQSHSLSLSPAAAPSRRAALNERALTCTGSSAYVVLPSGCCTGMRVTTSLPTRVRPDAFPCPPCP